MMMHFINGFSPPEGLDYVFVLFLFAFVLSRLHVSVSFPNACHLEYVRRLTTQTNVCHRVYVHRIEFIFSILNEPSFVCLCVDYTYT